VATGELERITHASSESRHSRNPTVSADGSRIAFESNSDFLGQGIPGHQFEIWLHDAATGHLSRVTAASNMFRDSHQACISPDGEMIAFHSDSDFLGEGDILYRGFEIWLYHVRTGDLERLTRATGPNRASSAPVIAGAPRP